jgi:S-adenosylmethionine uptake transporter
MLGAGPARSPIFVFAVAAIGIAIFSLMDAVMKGLTLALGAYTTILWRSMAGVLVSGVLYVAQRPPLPSRTVFRLHLVRGGLAVVSAVAFFWGLARMPMAQAVALSFIAPLLALFLAALLLGERIKGAAFLGSLSALAGVIVILAGQWQSQLGPEAFRGAVAVLFSALCYAYNVVLMRQQAQVAGPIEVAFFQSLIVAVLMMIGAPFLADVPALAHMPMIFVAACLAVASLLILAWAYARGEASYLVSTEYTAFVWAAIYGWLFFGEHVALPTLIGAGLIVAGCVIAARQKAISTGGIEVGM